MEEQKKTTESKSASAANKDAADYSSMQESVNNTSTTVNKDEEELRIMSEVLGLISRDSIARREIDKIILLLYPGVFQQLMRGYTVHGAHECKLYSS